MENTKLKDQDRYFQLLDNPFPSVEFTLNGRSIDQLIVVSLFTFHLATTLKELHHSFNLSFILGFVHVCT